MTSQVWDSAGCVAFQQPSVTAAMSVKLPAAVDAHGIGAVLILASVQDADSFDAVPAWLGDIRSLLGAKVPVFLVATKCDGGVAPEAAGARSDAGERVSGTARCGSSVRGYRVGANA